MTRIDAGISSHNKSEYLPNHVKREDGEEDALHRYKKEKKRKAWNVTEAYYVSLDDNIKLMKHSLTTQYQDLRNFIARDARNMINSILIFLKLEL